MEKGFLISQPQREAGNLLDFLNLASESEEPVRPILQDAALVNYVMEALNKTSILHDLQIIREILWPDTEFRIVWWRLRDRIMEYIYWEKIISVDVDVVVRCPPEVLYNIHLPGNLGRTSVGGLRRIFNGTQYDIRSMLNDEYIQATAPSYVVENPWEWRTFTDGSYKDWRPSIYAVLSTFSTSMSKIAFDPVNNILIDMGAIGSIKTKRIEPAILTSYETWQNIYAIAKIVQRHWLVSHHLYWLLDEYSPEMQNKIVEYMQYKRVEEEVQQAVLTLLMNAHEESIYRARSMII